MDKGFSVISGEKLAGKKTPRLFYPLIFMAIKFGSMTLGVLIALGIAEFAQAQEIKNRTLTEQVVTDTVIAQAVERNRAEAERLINQGLRQINANNPQGAIEPSKAALELYQQMGDRPGAARAFTNLGLAYFDLEQYQQAVNAFQQALHLTTQLGNKKGMSVTQDFLNVATQKLRESQVSENPTSNPTATRNQAQKLDNEANFAWNLKGFDRSLQKWQQALPLWRSLGDKEKEARTLIGIGNAQHRLDAYTEALSAYQSALPFYKRNDNQIWQSIILNNLGLTYAELGNLPKALENLQQALDISLNLKDLNGQAKTLQNLGILYATQGNQQEAADTQRQVLALVRKESQKNCDEDHPSIVCPGPLERQLEEVQRGLEEDNEPVSSSLSLEETLLNTTQAQNRRLEESHRQMLEEQQNPETLTIKIPFTQTYRLVKDCAVDMIRGGCVFDQPQWVQEQESEAVQLYAKGREQRENDQYEAALQSFQQALRQYKETTNLYIVADLFTDIGAIYQIFGLDDEAKTAFQEAEQTLEAIADTGDIVYEDNEPLFKASKFNNLASLQLKDDVAAAKNYLSAILEIQGHLQRESSRFNPGKPITSVQKASANYAIAFKTKGTVSSLDTLNANIYLNREYFQIYATASQGLGRTRLNQGKYEEAQKRLEESLAIAQNIQDLSLIASASKSLGRLHHRQNKISTAKDYFQQALTLSEKIGDRRQEMSVLYHWSVLEKKQGNLPQAEKLMEKSTKIIETLRITVTAYNLEWRQLFFANVQEYYRFYLDLLMELHQQNPSQYYDQKAFNISEQMRGRTLLELLTEANANIKEGVDPQLLAREKSLQDQLDATEKQRLEIYNNPNSTPEQKEAIDQKLKTLRENEYLRLQNEIRRNSPKYADLKYPQPLTLEQVQQQILDEDTVLLQYSLGEERSYVWVVTKEGMNSYQLPSQEEIEKRAENVFRRIQQAIETPKASAQAITVLSKVILDPVKDKLTKKRVLIVADGVLQYIPFAALSFSEKQQPLITNYEIINLPSSSSLATIRNEIQARKSAPKALAVLADPVFSADDERINNGQTTLSQQPTSDLGSLALQRSVRSLEDGKFIPLPGTRQEAENILKLIPEDSQKTSAFGFDANLPTATNPQLSQYRIVHFATHGILNTESPELSGVVLSLVDKNGNFVNGFLRLNEIFNLKLPAEIVVLSACQMGLGKQIKGEGLVGLTRGFMYAGSPRVLVSLWKVDDEATAEIMTRFYRLMLEKKLSPAEALREAQLEMQQETEWKSPYYWAAFVLQGEWR